ncbi:protein GumN [Shewanella colwelliana]|uniref:TraB/GumN family protein n=1 Tax=Shewanella colwelliana TaxID=23 RepID=UPI001BBBB181|nr:TraB/GumN family protein [Shewanella colwelliana]GIU16237.1 protein GumN [Shewanella colwelliana]
MATSRGSLLLALVGLFYFFSGTDAKAAVTDKPPFYQLEYRGKTAYLLGSIHVGRDDFYPMAPQIERAFAKAGALVVEADIDNVDVMALIRQYGLSSTPQGANVEQRMAQYCQYRGTLCDSLRPYSAWMQAMQLSVMRFDELGYQAQFGVDQMLVQKNRPRPLIELESTEFQFKLLASFSAKTQWDMVIEAIDAPDDEMLNLIYAWRDGDEEALDKLMQAQMPGEDTELLEKLLWQRNVNMSNKIAQLMADDSTPEPLFIVVGAGHVVGGKSIPAKMQQLFDVKATNCWQQRCQ